MQDQRSGYSQQELEDVEIIWFDKNIYVPLTQSRRVLYRYYFYLNHPGVIRLANVTRKVWYCKGLVTQAGLSIKMCNKLQKFINRKTIYGQLPPNIIESLKPLNLVHINLIGPYSKSIIKQKPGGAIIKKYLILAYITIIGPATGWFKIVKVPWFDLDEVARGNNEYVDKLSARVIHMFNKTFLYR